MATNISISGSGNQDINVLGRGTVIAGNGNDSINIAGGGQIIVGSGNDTLSLGMGGIISQSGAAGHDTINIGAGNATVYEQGQATITGAFGSATISGGTFEINQTPDPTTGSTGSSTAHTTTHTISPTTAHTVSGGQVTQIGSAVGTSRTDQFGVSWHTPFVGTAGAHMVGVAGFAFATGAGVESMVGASSHNFFEHFTEQKVGTSLIKNFVSGASEVHVEGKALAYLPQNHEVTTQGSHTLISLDGGMTQVEVHGLKASDITGKH